MGTTTTISTAPELMAFFDPAAVEDLPEPARRWLRRSLAPGAAMTHCVELNLAGRIRLGSWRRYTAYQQLNALDGYMWAETTSILGVPVRGWDRLLDGAAEMRHTLLGRLPLVSAEGHDLTRSAAARLACELAYTPGAALDPRVTWDQMGWNTAVARVEVAGEPVEVMLDVSRDGGLSSVRCWRWAKVGRRPWDTRMFEVRVLAEGSSQGIRYPRRVVAGYVAPDLLWPKGAFLDQSVVGYRPSAEPLPLTTV